MTRLIPHALFMLLVSGTAVSAQNAEILRVEGRAARLAGQFDNAILTLQRASQAEPQNADVHVELGLALTGATRFPEAGASFRRALEILPDYTEAKLGLARLEYFQGRFAEARAMAVQVDAAEPNGGAKSLLAEIDKAIEAQEIAAREAAAREVAAREAAEREALAREVAAQEAARKEEAARKAENAASVSAPRPRKSTKQITRIDLGAYDVTPASAPAPAPTRWRLDLDGSGSNLSGDRPNWREATGRLGYEVRPGTTVSGAFHAAQRYGQDDTYLEARLDHKLSAATSFYLQTGVTPDADFLPEWSAGAGGAVRVHKSDGVFAATVLTLDARVSDYTTGTVQTYATGIEQYLMDGRLWLTFRWIHLVDAEGDYHNGYVLRGDVVVNDSLRIFAGYADAPETDEGLTFVTRSLFGGVICAIDERTDLKFSLAHEERVGLFDLNSVSTGITYRF